MRGLTGRLLNIFKGFGHITTTNDHRSSTNAEPTTVPSYSSVLPDHQACLSSSDAHGARNAGGDSVAQRLQVRAFHEGDQIIAPGDGMHLLDHRTVKLHVRQLLHEILHAGRFSLDQYIGVEHEILLCSVAPDGSQAFILR